MFSRFVVVAALMLPIVCSPPAHAGGASARLVKNQADGIVYAVPKRSPFRVAKMSDEGLHFRGRAVISGRYVFGRNAPMEEAANGSKEPELHFVPDPASAALLPRWNLDGAIDGFYFSNRDDFLKAVIPSETVSKVRAGKIKSVSGPLTLEIEGYFATVICGMPAYATRFIGVARQPQVIAANQHAQGIGCRG